MSSTNEEFKDYKARTDAEVAQLNEQVAELRRAVGITTRPVRQIVKDEARTDSRAEFIARNGGQAAMVPVGGKRYLFPTGAAVTLDGAFWGLSEPPIDAWENNRARRAYWVAKLERAEDDFQQLKSAALGMKDATGMPMQWTWNEAEYGAAPTERDHYGRPDAETALKRLKAVVRERRQAVNAIDKEPVALKRREIAKKHQREELARISLASERRQQLEAINI